MSENELNDLVLEITNEVQQQLALSLISERNNDEAF